MRPLGKSAKGRTPHIFRYQNRDSQFGVTVVSAESLAMLKRDARIVDGRGGTLFSALKVVARTEAVTFTALRPEPVDSRKLAQEVGRLKGLKKREKIVELDATAKALGVPLSDEQMSGGKGTNASTRSPTGGAGSSYLPAPAQCPRTA
jgi:hypothetical protein